MIDPTTEQLLTLAQAARTLPRLRGDRPVSPSTLWRWATHGLRGVRLEVIRVGGTTCTSAEALARYMAALSGHAAPRPLSHQQREDAVEAALTARGM